MLEIGQSQIQALEEAQTDRFISSLANHLRLAFNDQFRNYSNADLLRFVHSCYVWANNYGAETEYDVRRFSEFVVIYGSHMNEDHVWIDRTLTRDDISGQEKMDILDNLEVQFIRFSL